MGTLPDPVRAAQALRATIRATRQETEETRRLAPPVVEGLLAAGLCRLAVPASLGGHEAAPVVALQVFEELAWADASVAWIAWNNHFVCLASRYVSDAVRTALFVTPGGSLPTRRVRRAAPWWSTAGFACPGGGRRSRAANWRTGCS
jgi:alkylation response protein AidB-like acyl-CoA dehydrogenase